MPPAHLTLPPHGPARKLPQAALQDSSMGAHACPACEITPTKKCSPKSPDLLGPGIPVLQMGRENLHPHRAVLRPEEVGV